MPTPTKQQDEQAREVERQERDKLSTLIGGQVIQALGRPPDMQRLQVRRLWETYYRINVFVGEDIASAKVAKSYFVRTNPDGRILESNPKITKRIDTGDKICLGPRPHLGVPRTARHAPSTREQRGRHDQERSAKCRQSWPVNISASDRRARHRGEDLG